MVNNALSCFSIEYDTIEELENIALKIIAFAKEVKIWIFHGEMGVGKTTLIKSIGKSLGVTELITSPTYALVNEYQGVEKEPLYHFDFYRIDDENEAWDIGVEEYFNSGHYCFVEWPAKIPSLLPHTDYLSIDMKAQKGKRTIVMTRL